MDLFKNITMLSLEQATVLPYLTFRLAQEGMQIYRMEHPLYGDPNRLIGDNVLGEERMNSYFLCINSGKKALTLDLADPEGQEIFQRMVKELKVDVFATNQLPKNYKKLGIDYESMRAVKQDMIWLGLTGFGPDSNEAAYDPILQARSGLMEMTGEAKGEPQVLGIPLPDMGTSVHAYGELMKALFKREATGEGSCIHISMFESSVSWLTVPITMTATFKKRITRRGNTHEFFCPVSVYRTKDGFAYMAMGNDRQWKSLVTEPMFKSLDKAEYEKNAGRIKDVENINKAINAITEKRSTDELVALFNRLTIPISKIKTIPEVVADPLVERKLVYSTDPKTGIKLTLAPPPSSTSYLEQNDRQMSFPPRFGEHNRAIYGKLLGYPDADLARLREKKVI
jgi:crotonobetainyl-CoA:carnitine CoA-transferase CaiB-like acyl-CoA transferase